MVSHLATRIPSATWAVGQSSWGSDKRVVFPLPLLGLRLYGLFTDSGKKGSLTKEFGLHLSVSGTPVLRIHGLCNHNPHANYLLMKRKEMHKNRVETAPAPTESVPCPLHHFLTTLIFHRE